MSSYPQPTASLTKIHFYPRKCYRIKFLFCLVGTASSTKWGWDYIKWGLLSWVHFIELHSRAKVEAQKPALPEEVNSQGVPISCRRLVHRHSARSLAVRGQREGMWTYHNPFNSTDAQHKFPHISLIRVTLCRNISKWVFLDLSLLCYHKFLKRYEYIWSSSYSLKTVQKVCTLSITPTRKNLLISLKITSVSNMTTLKLSLVCIGN